MTELGPFWGPYYSSYFHYLFENKNKIIVDWIPARRLFRRWFPALDLCAPLRLKQRHDEAVYRE
ncbi:MAG: hypothetical protein JHD35_17405 [Sphingopyxis sp.]|nr:hypothetical protein [Sphingopyxis sp.]